MESNTRLLAPCPDSPNCVSTSSKSKRHYIEPYRYTVDPKKAIHALKKAVSRLGRAKLVVEEPDYLHYKLKSLLFGFIDDVEFLIDERSKQIHFRSASRTGYSDFGTNRKRMERLRSLLKGTV